MKLNLYTELNADFLHLQFIVLIVLAILMVSIFLFFIYWKDRQHPDSDQGAVAGFIQFVSDAWVIQNTLPNSSISSHQSSNKTESKSSDWEGKGGGAWYTYLRRLKAFSRIVTTGRFKLHFKAFQNNTSSLFAAEVINFLNIKEAKAKLTPPPPPPPPPPKQV